MKTPTELQQQKAALEAQLPALRDEVDATADALDRAMLAGKDTAHGHKQLRGAQRALAAAMKAIDALDSKIALSAASQRLGRANEILNIAERSRRETLGFFAIPDNLTTETPT